MYNTFAGFGVFVVFVPPRAAGSTFLLMVFAAAEVTFGCLCFTYVQEQCP